MSDRPGAEFSSRASNGLAGSVSFGGDRACPETLRSRSGTVGAGRHRAVAELSRDAGP